MATMIDSWDYLVYVLTGLGIVGGVIGVGLGIYLATKGRRNRGWESPRSLIARDGFSVLALSLIFTAYLDARLDSFWSILSIAVVGLPSMLYVLRNDRKYAEKQVDQ